MQITDETQSERFPRLTIWPWGAKPFTGHIDISHDFSSGTRGLLVVRPNISFGEAYTPDTITMIANALIVAALIARGGHPGSMIPVKYRDLVLDWLQKVKNLER